MPEEQLRIYFLSDWHVGSGLGDGAIADAVLNRDANGIPVIPGSAIKGAMREGSWRLAMCDRDGLGWLTGFVFGTASEAKISNQPGVISVGEGLLPKDLRTWLLAQDEVMRRDTVTDMTIIRQQTRLDRRKMVVDHSLRSTECGIPGLVFESWLELNVPEETTSWFRAWLGAVCACVKSIGADRARGIGRCRISLADAQKTALPGPQPAALLALRQKWEKK